MTWCPECGYDVEGLRDGAPCPECGSSVIAAGRRELAVAEALRVSRARSWFFATPIIAIPAVMVGTCTGHLWLAGVILAAIMCGAGVWLLWTTSGPPGHRHLERAIVWGFVLGVCYSVSVVLMLASIVGLAAVIGGIWAMPSILPNWPVWAVAASGLVGMTAFVVVIRIIHRVAVAVRT